MLPQHLGRVALTSVSVRKPSGDRGDTVVRIILRGDAVAIPVFSGSIKKSDARGAGVVCDWVAKALPNPWGEAEPRFAEVFLF